jgi:hypothetical protein
VWRGLHAPRPPFRRCGVRRGGTWQCEHTPSLDKFTSRQRSSLKLGKPGVGSGAAGNHPKTARRAAQDGRPRRRRRPGSSCGHCAEAPFNPSPAALRRRDGRAPPPVSAIATSQALYATLQGQQGQRGAGAPSSSAHRVPERSHRPCVRALLVPRFGTVRKLTVIQRFERHNGYTWLGARWQWGVPRHGSPSQRHSSNAGSGRCDRFSFKFKHASGCLRHCKKAYSN